MGDYTESVLDTIYSYLETNGSEYLEVIKSESPDTPPEVWKKKLQNIALDNKYSGRYALIRFLESRAQKKDTGFYIVINSKSFDFPPVSMEQAQKLPSAESEMFVDLLYEIACPSVMNTGNDIGKAAILQYQDYIRGCIRHIWDRSFDSSSDYSREELLFLGHSLHLTLNEMQDFLLRVKDFEDGLKLTSSHDLIDIYGFLMDIGPLRVKSLKEKYDKELDTIEKTDNENRNNHWTRRLNEDLLSCISVWKKDPDPDSRFFEWLATIASCLDIASKTARTVFRNLAAYTIYLNTHPWEKSGEEFLPFIQDLTGREEETEEAKRLFVEGNDADLLQSCSDTAAEILYLLSVNTAQKSGNNVWEVAHLNEKSALVSAGGPFSSPKERIRDILFGTTSVEKADLLLLIWCIANMVWIDFGRTGSNNDRCNNLQDLLDISETVLRAARVSPFYCPHPLEQILMLSVVFAQENPAECYAQFCLWLKETRSTSGHTEKRANKTPLEKKFILACCNGSGKTQREIAELFQVGESSIREWKKSYSAPVEKLQEEVNEQTKLEIVQLCEAAIKALKRNNQYDGIKATLSKNSGHDGDTCVTNSDAAIESFLDVDNIYTPLKLDMWNFTLSNYNWSLLGSRETKQMVIPIIREKYLFPMIKG